MNIRTETIQPDTFYHIYNRGINSVKIFDSEENYLFFLSKFTTYLNPVCDVFAFCLMPNHFHFLIKVKSKDEISTFVKVLNFEKGEMKSTKVQNIDKDDIIKQEKGLHSFDAIVSKQMGKFVSSYSQAYNKVTNRHGALFESPFKRKRVESEEYLRNLIIYIHLNPLDIKQNFETYLFSSYKAILSNKKTNLKSEETIVVFGDKANFIYLHNNPPKFDFKF